VDALRGSTQVGGAQVDAHWGARWGRGGPPGGPCNPLLPLRPDNSDADDDATGLPLTSGNCVEATVIELAALVIT
jgi:hypothetical protein